MATVPNRLARQGLQTPVGIDYPGSTPMGRAVSNFGQEMSGIAATLQKRQDEDDRFKARIAYEKFNADIAGDFENAKTSMAADGQGFHDGFVGQLDPETGQPVKPGAFDERLKQFTESLPDSQRERYLALAGVDRVQWSTRAASTQNDQRTTYFRTETSSNLDRIAANIAASNPEDAPTYASYLDQGLTLIDATGLSAAEKESLKLKWRSTAAETSWKALANENPAQARSAIGLDPGGQTSARSVIRSFEGFRSVPYWDVNAWRVGYGSDTITRADGTVERVTPQSHVTRDDAERDLARREGEFETAAIAKIGEEAWTAMPPNAQAAIKSITYNYGETPDRIVDAARSGDMLKLSKAVEALSGDNDGVNRNRRMKEAALIRGEGTIDDRFADLAPDQIESARKALAAQDTRIQAMIEDDLVSVRTTGQGVGIDPVAARSALTPTQFAAYESKRRAAEAVYKNTVDLPIMPASQIEERLASLKPEPGAPDYAVRYSVWQDVAKEVEAVEKLRRDDPARAVRMVPEVKEAYAAIQPDKPETIQNAVKVNLEAQATAGIPSHARRAITTTEAKDIALPVISAGRLTGRDDVSKDEMTALRAVVLDITRNYGPYAKDILPQVIEETTKDRQLGPLAASVFRKLVAGERVTAQDRQNIETAADAANASRAMGTTAPVRTPVEEAPAAMAEEEPAAPRGRPTAGTGTPSAPTTSRVRQGTKFPTPNPRHIAALIHDPSLASAFEEKFGPGSAEQYVAAADAYGGGNE